MRRWRGGGAWAVLCLLAAAHEAAAQDRAPAGSYHCLTSSFTLSRGITYEASALGRIDLDGGSEYRISASGNRGHYRIAGSAFVFVDGPLAGWPAVLETSDGRPRIRLGRSRGTPPNPEGPATGEHRCTLRD